MSPTPQTIIQTAEVPPIPGVLQQILALADDPRTTSSELEKLVSQEPALASQLLKWVNSAYYALPRRVSSISHAMILLGFSTVKSLASGLMLINAFNDMSTEHKEFVSRVWEHCLLGANFSKILSYREASTKQDDLFLAAMIHDVGYIILREYFAKRYAELLKKNHFPTPEEENAELGVNHVEIGTAILENWIFPEEVTELVRHHHNLNAYPGNKKDIAFLILSDKLSDLKHLRLFFEKEQKEVDPKLLDLFKLAGWEWPQVRAAKKKFLDAFEMTHRLFTQSNG